MSQLDLDTWAYDMVHTSHLWQNPSNRFDVNHDGFVAPNDALIVSNAVTQLGAKLLDQPPGPSDSFYDVDGDNVRSLLDARQIIDVINQGDGNVTSAWRNPTDFLDVNADGTDDIRDAQAILDYLNAASSTPTDYAMNNIVAAHIRGHGGNDVLVGQPSLQGVQPGFTLRSTAARGTTSPPLPMAPTISMAAAATTTSTTIKGKRHQSGAGYNDINGTTGDGSDNSASFETSDTGGVPDWVQQVYAGNVPAWFYNGPCRTATLTIGSPAGIPVCIRPAGPPTAPAAEERLAARRIRSTFPGAPRILTISLDTRDTICRLPSPAQAGNSPRPMASKLSRLPCSSKMAPSITTTLARSIGRPFTASTTAARRRSR